jgi:hypothetical protein
MKKADLIAQLEGAKALTSVVSIDNVIALIQGLEAEVRVEKVFGITEELAENIADRIERCLDYNSNSLIDFDSAEFELSYSNEISLTSADVNIRDIMEHVTATLDEFITEEDEEGEEGVITDVDPETQIDGFIEAQIDAEQASQEE